MQPPIPSRQQCTQCGATYAEPSQSCMTRFERLLSLTKHQAGPWQSTLGTAYVTFCLQHPQGQPIEVLERSWIALYRIVQAGDDPKQLFWVMQQEPTINVNEWSVPQLPPTPPAGFYAVTIADLGDFPAELHYQQVSQWAKATLEAWRAVSGQ
jgi:hypothetical protein